MPAFVLASIALFAALTGGAVAAGVVPLAQHAITAGTASNALKLGGKSPAQIKSSLRGARGLQGPAGAAGPAGPTGPAGAASTLGLQFVSGESGFDSSSPKSATATCPTGKRAISWSFNIQLSTSANPNTAPGVSGITPIDFDAGSGKLPGAYTVTAETTGFYPDAWKLFAYVTCANS
ncbi:MAG TPA: hypothetical protein VLK36_10240 [Gaiellaceae bacterium]|nr:hypothetical protein [Gaiellaceae bacterium]